MTKDLNESIWGSVGGWCWGAAVELFIVLTAIHPFLQPQNSPLLEDDDRGTSSKLENN